MKLSEKKTTSSFVTGHRELVLNFYREMVRVRHFELSLVDFYTSKKIIRPSYFSTGQEAAGVGTAGALQTEDVMIVSHRGYHFVLPRGLAMEHIVDELFHRESGTTGGRWGRNIDPALGILPYTELLGGNFALAAGTGLAIQNLKQEKVCACIFGDGTATRGTFQSAVNLSAIWKLPILWICENNQYSVTVRTDRLIAGGSVWKRAAGYGIPGYEVNGNDVIEVYEGIRRAREMVLDQQTPVIVELQTYRSGRHTVLMEDTCQPHEEMEEARRHDPIVTLERQLHAAKVITEAEREQVVAEVRKRVDDIIYERTRL
jgi:pyruvate dehydrogenase E1 component alpha subunit